MPHLVFDSIRSEPNPEPGAAASYSLTGGGVPGEGYPSDGALAASRPAIWAEWNPEPMAAPPSGPTRHSPRPGHEPLPTIADPPHAPHPTPPLNTPPPTLP